MPAAFACNLSLLKDIFIDGRKRVTEINNHIKRKVEVRNVQKILTEMLKIYTLATHDTFCTTGSNKKFF